MELLHPHIARLSCSDCKKWIVNIKTGEIESRGGKWLERPQGMPTPCGQCPKRKPENEKYCKLSEVNSQAVQFYHRYQALGWDGIPAECRGEQFIVESFTIIHQVMAEYRIKQTGESVANELLPLLIKKAANQ